MNKECNVMYAKCKYVECAQKFKFDIPHNNPLVPLTIFLYSTDTSNEVHPTDEKLYYPLLLEDKSGGMFKKS